VAEKRAAQCEGFVEAGAPASIPSLKARGSKRVEVAKSLPRFRPDGLKSADDKAQLENCK